MSAIRPFAESDLSAVGGLHRRLYPGNPFPEEELQSYFRRIFFENPWYDPEFPSLVSEDSAGRVIGFLGVMQRRMVFQGSPIRVAVSAQLVPRAEAAPPNRPHVRAGAIEQHKEVPLRGGDCLRRRDEVHRRGQIKLPCPTQLKPPEAQQPPRRVSRAEELEGMHLARRPPRNRKDEVGRSERLTLQGHCFAIVVNPGLPRAILPRHQRRRSLYFRSQHCAAALAFQRCAG